MFKNAAPMGNAYSKPEADKEDMIMKYANRKAENEAWAKDHGTHTCAARFETSKGYVHGLVEWKEAFVTIHGEKISVGMTPAFVPDETGEKILNKMYDMWPGNLGVSEDLKWVDIPLSDGHYGIPEYKLDYSIL